MPTRASWPACRRVFPGVFAGRASVLKKSNEITVQGGHNRELSCARSGDLVLRDESRQSWEGHSVLIRLMPWTLRQGYRKQDDEKVSGEL